MNMTQRIIVYMVIIAAVLVFLWATAPENTPEPQTIFLPMVKSLPASVTDDNVKFVKQPLNNSELLGTISLMRRYSELTPQLEAEIRQAVVHIAGQNGANRIRIQYFVSNPGQQMAAYWLEAQAYRQ